MAWSVSPIPNSSGVGVPHGTSVQQIPQTIFLNKDVHPVVQTARGLPASRSFSD
jgi:hypothetical protein